MHIHPANPRSLSFPTDPGIVTFSCCAQRNLSHAKAIYMDGIKEAFLRYQDGIFASKTEQMALQSFPQ